MTFQQRVGLGWVGNTRLRRVKSKGAYKALAYGEPVGCIDACPEGPVGAVWFGVLDRPYPDTKANGLARLSRGELRLKPCLGSFSTQPGVASRGVLAGHASRRANGKALLQA